MIGLGIIYLSHTVHKEASEGLTQALRAVQKNPCLTQQCSFEGTVLERVMTGSMPY